MRRSSFDALILGATGALASACAPPHDAPPKCAPTLEAAPAPPAVAASSWSAADSPACAAPDGRDPPLALNGAPLVVLCRGLYADPATSPADRHALARWYGESLVGLASVFGAAKSDPPLVVACKSDACALHFAGPTRRSRAILGAKPRPMVVISGLGSLTKGTILHEMVHVEIARRLGTAPARALPTWFNEGVATFVGDNARCPPGTKRAVDDLRRLDAPAAWEGVTNMTGRIEGAYCQARDEIAAWGARRGKPALVELINAVAAGQSFDAVYGPLVTALPEASYDRSLDGRFALDENVGTNAIDESGRSHIGSLLNGAIWTTGHHGSAVKVIGGSYLRADGFADLGVPDSPFSIALWARPLSVAKVLVHASMNAGGGDGWCNPILGHDATGHLVAEVNYDADPKAFLAAIGPVLPLNAWAHLVVTWSAEGGVRLYVNGALAASAAPKSAAERHRLAPASPVYLFFGSDHGSRCWAGSIEPGDWNGAIDEVRVFNYALSPEHVTSDLRGP
jgi:hypothetical protein